jgi:hypothetical protein
MSVGVHPHPAPHEALGKRHSAVGERLLLAVEEAAFLLQPRDHLVGVEEGPVAEHDHMLAIVDDAVGAGRVDHERTVEPLLLLQPGMAVIPIGAGLPHGNS